MIQAVLYSTNLNHQHLIRCASQMMPCTFAADKCILCSTRATMCHTAGKVLLLTRSARCCWQGTLHAHSTYGAGHFYSFNSWCRALLLIQLMVQAAVTCPVNSTGSPDADLATSVGCAGRLPMAGMLAKALPLCPLGALLPAKAASTVGADCMRRQMLGACAMLSAVQREGCFENHGVKGHVNLRDHRVS